MPSSYSVCKYPLAAVSVPNSGDQFWNAASDGKTDDGQYAFVSLSGGRSSEDLLFSAFGFNIPSGAVIKGIEVRFEGHASMPSRVYNSKLKLTPKPGTNDLSTPDCWPSSDTTFVRGSASELWGSPSGWTAADFNTDSFGVLFAFTTVQKTVVGHLDFLNVTIYYET